ncbi:MAG: hypothetical protein WAO58_00740 [Fimbriimonadaceae bacterium]|mgnify:CR=1 FL=1
MKRVLSIGSLLSMGFIALAFAPAVKVFDTTFNVKAGSVLGKARCQTCHDSKSGGKKLNPYGKDLQNVMKQAGSKSVTSELLLKIGSLDSDKDGIKNAEEIKEDRMPGK